MTKERYIKLLCDELVIEYHTVLEANFVRQSNDKFDLVLRRFIATLVLLSEICGYTPEGLSSSDIILAAGHAADAKICKKVLLDCTLNEALTVLADPVDLSDVYRITFDRSYSYIPRDKRPKPGFMNPPEEV